MPIFHVDSFMVKWWLALTAVLQPNMIDNFNNKKKNNILKQQLKTKIFIQRNMWAFF